MKMIIVQRTATCLVVGVVFLLSLTDISQEAVWIPAESNDFPDCHVENLHFANANEGWAVGYVANQGGRYALLRTADGGRTWHGEPVDLRQYRIYKEAYFLTPTEGWTPADVGIETHTDDAGYGRINGHNPGEDNSLNAPVRFYQTQDGGATWTLKQGVITETVIIGGEEAAKSADRKYLSVIAFPSRNEGVMGGVIGQSFPDRFFPGTRFKGYVLLSTRDGGNTWKAFLWGDSRLQQCIGEDWSPWVFEDIEFVGENFGWLSGKGCGWNQLFRTQDGGRTWEVIEFRWLPPVIGKQVEFVSPTEGWSWHRTLTRTTDGGQTWEAQNFVGWGVYFASSIESWVIGAGGVDERGNLIDTPGIYYTMDGGRNWKLELTPASIRTEITQLAFDPSTRLLWGMGYGNHPLIYRTVIRTDIRPQGKLATVWGQMKQ